MGSLAQKLHDFGLPADWGKHRRDSDLKWAACGQQKQTKAYTHAYNKKQKDKTQNDKDIHKQHLTTTKQKKQQQYTKQHKIIKQHI